MATYFDLASKIFFVIYNPLGYLRIRASVRLKTRLPDHSFFQLQRVYTL